MSKSYLNFQSCVNKAIKKFRSDFDVKNDEILELSRNGEIIYGYFSKNVFVAYKEVDGSVFYLDMYFFDKYPQFDSVFYNMMTGQYEVKNTHRKHVSLKQYPEFNFKPDWDV